MQDQEKDQDDLQEATLSTEVGKVGRLCSSQEVQTSVHNSELALSDKCQSITRSLNAVPKFTDEWFQLKEQQISICNKNNACTDDLEEQPGEQIINADSLKDSKPVASTMECFPEGPPPLPYSQHDANEDMSSKDTDEMIKDKAKLVCSIEAMPDSPAPVPFSQAGNVSSKNTDEIIIKDKAKLAGSTEAVPDSPAPVPLAQAAETSDEVVIKEKVKTAGMVQLPSDSPMPFTSQEGPDIYAKNKEAATQLPILRDERINIATTAINRLDSKESDVIQSNSRQADFSGTGAQLIDAQPRHENNNTIGTQRQTTISSLGMASMSPTIVFEPDASISVIPEAFLVESVRDDQVLAVAEQILPWWQRKTTYAFCFIMLLTIIGVGAGTTRFVKRRAAQQLDDIMLLMANETTESPSMSSAPTSSRIPSAQPSSCVDRSSMDPQSLEFLYFNLTSPLIAVDGGHIVVVDIHVENGVAYLYVEFYRKKYGRWEQDQHFAEQLSRINDNAQNWDYHWDDAYSLGMTKNTVLVGAPFMNNGTGAVFVYEYIESIREWMRFNDAIVPSDGGEQGRRFGESLDIDNDLAVIFAPSDNTVFVFRHDRKFGWNQTVTFGVHTNTTDVTLSGNTIVATVGYDLHLYEYDRESNGVGRKQQLNLGAPSYYSSSVGTVGLSENHLAVPVFEENVAVESSGNGCYDFYLRAISRVPLYEIVLYYRPNITEDYKFLQQINSVDIEHGFAPYLSLDDDFLFVGGAGNTTTTFTFSNGYWEESMVLYTPDECGSDGYLDMVSVSKRTAVVSTWDTVYVYDVDECAPMPSSTPSEAPTAQPTVTCYWVDFFVEYHHANEPEWLLEQLLLDEEDETALDDQISAVPTLKPTFMYTTVNPGYDPARLTYATERKCLEEGRYKFIIFNDPLFYNLTSYGDVIADGGDFGYKESTIFNIPLQ